MTLASKARFKSRAIWLSVALFLGTPALHAEDAETRTAARDLATQGAQAFDAGHFAEAADFFKRAHELVQAPSIALLQARSLAKVGQLLEAIDVYEQTAHFKLLPDSPEAYAQAVETARSEVEEVRKRVPRLKLTLIGVSSGEAPQVSIDDRPTPAALLGVERPINPGMHHLAVHVAGQMRASRELSLVEAESYRVELDVRPAHPAEKAVVAAPAPVNVEDPPNQASSPSSSLRTIGYVGLGVGALGLGIGTYTGIVALHHKSNLDDACKPGCPASMAGDIDGFRSNRTVSWISYGVGIAAVATGVVLIMVGKPSQEHVALRALPNGLQIGGRL